MAKLTRKRVVTVSPQAHQQFVTDVLAAAGAAPSDADNVSQALLWAELRGRHTNGLIRLPNLVQRLTQGLIRSPATMTWTLLAPSADRLDAGDGFGQIAGRMAMERAIELAKTQGVGLVAVRRSNHYGVASYYCAQAADAGCLGFTYTNAVAKVAAFGGRGPVLGTNPLAFGCPTASGAPILVDLSTSAISGSEIRSKSGRKNSRLPAGVALDKNGHPTNEPDAVPAGCLLPAAGPKGFGLGLMVEILSGVVTGAAIGQEVGSLFHTWDRPVNVGHLFIAIDIDRFMPREEFLTRLDLLLGWIAASPRRNADEPIRFPGEIRARYAERYMEEGIPVAEETTRALEKLALSLKVACPW